MSVPPALTGATLIAQRDEDLQARIVAARPLHGNRSKAVRAGSALLASGTRLLLVQDDAWAAAWLDLETGIVSPLVMRGSGEALPKANKPDFEAAFFVDERRICLLGSGATPLRAVAALIDIVDGSVAIQPLPRLYASLAATLGTAPNIEGGLCRDGRLLLLHRGSGAQPSALCRCHADVLRGGAAALVVQPCALGTVNGVPLAFTDAAPLDAQRFAYLAVAEDTPDAIADGPVAGTAVGFIGEGHGYWTLLCEADGRPSRRKAEGLVLDADRCHGWVITDPDDPHQPAELCRVALAGFDISPLSAPASSAR